MSFHFVLAANPRNFRVRDENHQCYLQFMFFSEKGIKGIQNWERLNNNV